MTAGRTKVVREIEGGKQKLEGEGGGVILACAAAVRSKKGRAGRRLQLQRKVLPSH